MLSTVLWGVLAGTILFTASTFQQYGIEMTGESGKAGFGYDAYKEQYCDMLEAGIVDPAKVTRSALQNAASIASTVLTTEAVVSEKKEDKPAPAMPAGGGMDGMY